MLFIAVPHQSWLHPPIFVWLQPRSQAEARRVTPPAGLGNCACFNLRPGSVIYLPPGHLHYVMPLEGGALNHAAAHTDCNELDHTSYYRVADLLTSTRSRHAPRIAGSFSVDLRVGHLSQAKWLCEAMYASLLSEKQQAPLVSFRPML